MPQLRQYNDIMLDRSTHAARRGGTASGFPASLAEKERAIADGLGWHARARSAPSAYRPFLLGLGLEPFPINPGHRDCRRRRLGKERSAGGLVARPSKATPSERPPAATPKGRAPFGRLLRLSSVTMRQHGSLLDPCTRQNRLRPGDPDWSEKDLGHFLDRLAGGSGVKIGEQFQSIGLRP